MAQEVDIIYMNLDQLLKDVCEFLDTGINKEVLTPEAMKQAKILIMRSKIQLKKIANLRNDYRTDEYMAMDRKLSVTEQLSESSDSKSVTSLQIDNENNWLYSDFPAKNLPTEEKNGYLSWKIKVIFNFERTQKIYAGIVGHWLLIYRSEKDSKPTHTYNLQNYEAKKSLNNNETNNETHFFLVNIKTNIANQFMALTPKDVDQWVVRINRCHQQAQQKNIEIDAKLNKEIPKDATEDSGEDEYDFITVEKHPQQSIVDMETEPVYAENEMDEEEVYEDLEIARLPFPPPPPRPVNLPINRYPIPNRMQRTPLPPLPVEERNSSESVASSNYQIMLINSDKVSIHSGRSNGSFSDEDEEEDIYDSPGLNVAATPVQVRETVIPVFKNTSATSPKPAIVPKPNVLTKPKIDVKLIKPSPYGTSSTKQILKLAKEKSMVKKQ